VVDCGFWPCVETKTEYYIRKSEATFAVENVEDIRDPLAELHMGVVGIFSVGAINFPEFLASYFRNLSGPTIAYNGEGEEAVNFPTARVSK
jgi:hypothetical protein